MSYHFDFDYIWANGPELLQGLVVTLKISVMSIVIAVVVGVAGAAVRALKVPVLSQLVMFYVSFVRNTPLLVQIFFIFYGLPAIGMGLSIYGSGLLALAAWGGAYNIENVRGGFLAVPGGLHEAARSLGLKPSQYIILVAIPLGLRVSLPAILNTAVSILKNSAYLEAIGLSELTFVAMEKVAMEFRTLEMFAAIGVLYLALVLVMSGLVRRLEVVLQRPFQAG